MINLRTPPPLSSCKNLTLYFFHGAFAPSFIWCRRPCKDQVISRVSMSASYLVTMSTVHVGCDKQTDMTMEKTLLN